MKVRRDALVQRKPHKSWILASTLVAAATTLLAACGQTSGADVALSSASAQGGIFASVVDSYSKANNLANQTLSVTRQNRDEQGTAAAIDDADFRLSREAGYQTAQGATYKPFYEALDRGVALGSTKQYPKILVTVDAQYTTTPKTANRSACRFLGVFAKNSSNAPWRVADEPTVTKTLLPRVKTVNENQGVVPPATAHLSIPLGRLAKYYAIALTTYYQEDVLSRGLKQANFSSSAQCWSLPPLSKNPFLGSKTIATSATVTAPNPAMVTLATANGGALAVFTLRVDLISSTTKNVSFSWRHSATDPDSYLLPAASGLHSIQIPLLFDLAVYDPPVTSADLAPRLVGSYWGPLFGGLESKRAPADI